MAASESSNWNDRSMGNGVAEGTTEAEIGTERSAKMWVYSVLDDDGDELLVEGKTVVIMVTVVVVA